jgi:hypothetical protein
MANVFMNTISTRQRKNHFVSRNDMEVEGTGFEVRGPSVRNYKHEPIAMRYLNVIDYHVFACSLTNHSELSCQKAEESALANAELLRVRGLHCVKASDLDIDDVYSQSLAYSLRSASEKRAFIHGSTKYSSSLSSGPPYNVPLCATCFCQYNMIPLRTYWRQASACRSGTASVSRKKPQVGHGQRAQIRNHVLPWMKEYASTHGCHMPDSNQIHIPNYCWISVYDKYRCDMPENTPLAANPSAFRAIVRKSLPHIKIRKVKRFTQCQICSEFDEAIVKAKGPQRSLLKRRKQDHLNWQKAERDVYYDHRHNSRLHPDQSVTISIDGMDNSKTNIGRFSREDKKTDSVDKLKCHLTGVLMHGRPKPARCYTWYDRFPGGADSVITILLHALCATLDDGPLPPTLYLHMDNCWRENKNK